MEERGAAERTAEEMMIRKKEYAQYIDIPKSKITAFDESLLREGNLQLQAHQKFVKNWFNPHTKHMRILLKHDPGMGKTLAALCISENFIKYYKLLPEDISPTVYIIGFSYQIFMKELFSRPELGYIAREDIIQHSKLQKLARMGTHTDKLLLQEFESRIRKKIKNKLHGGYYKFFGYKEFFNRMFQFAEGIDSSSLKESELFSMINEGKVTANTELMEKFNNSLVICDEIHRVYNTDEYNNYGLALRYLFIHFDKNGKNILGANAPRVVFMSATPVNNNATEVVDLLNLLIPGASFKKEDLFTEAQKLKPGALNNVFNGYVSYLRDKGSESYPTQHITGTEMKIPADLRKHFPGNPRVLPYLKFVQCPMSPPHIAALKEKQGIIPIDSYALYDMVFPAPKGKFVYNAREVRDAITNAPKTWKEKQGIDIIRLPGAAKMSAVTGSFLEYKNIGRYSGKYKQMLTDLHKIKNEKILIIHSYVELTGTTLIQEMLRRNGFVDYSATAVQSTRCVVCGIVQSSHKHATEKHDFVPAKFVTIDGRTDNSTIARNLEVYNSKANKEGHEALILVGSRKIYEAYDFKAVRHEFVMSFPPNIPTLIQIFGRPVRKNSHIDLPESHRNVNTRVYISTGSGTIERIISEKMLDYLEIQIVERAMNASAIDKPMNYAKIFAKNDVLPPLRYPASKLQKPKQIDEFDFDAHFAQTEVIAIAYIIKRLFMEVSQVWQYADLWKAVQKPSFDIQTDPRMFDEHSFVLALDSLTYADKTYIDIAGGKGLFDPYDKKISIDGTEHYITYVGGYYILFPIKQLYTSRGIGKASAEWNGVPDVSSENWQCYVPAKPRRAIDITEGMSTSYLSFEKMFYKFYYKYRLVPMELLPSNLEIYGIDFHIRMLETCIKYVFNLYTNKNQPFSELHEFYFRILYFYNNMELILFAGDATDELYNSYKKYITPPAKPGKKSSSSYDPTDIRLNAFLMSSIAKSEGKLPAFDITRLNSFILESRKMSPKKNTELMTSLEQKKKPIQISELNFAISKEITETKAKEINKVPERMLPIGHFLSQDIKHQINPKVYNPDKNQWSLYENFIRDYSTGFPENDIIIGYYEKSPHSLQPKFKLRIPAQAATKHKDARLNEKGYVCQTKNVPYLSPIAKSLGLKPAGAISDLCRQIKLELQRRELIDRRRARKGIKKGGSGPPKRWFYMHFE